LDNPGTTRLAEARLLINTVPRSATSAPVRCDTPEPSFSDGSGPRRTARGWPLREQPLEPAPWDPNHPAVLADLDPELHGLPLAVPAGVLGEWRLGNGKPRTMMLQAPSEASKRQALGRAV
jgi:hypothetical protein